MQQQKIRIATRKSPLAMWQAEFVRDQLLAAHSGLEVELITFTTLGDKILDSPLSKVGGKGLFVKELEQALLDGRADIAVHSMKDVPAEFPEGLGLAVILEREDPRDAFVSNHHDLLENLPPNAVVGTSSLRRQCQLRAMRPDLVIKDLRGNVNTRLSKLDAGDYDAIILASAGLIRLNMEDRITEYLAQDVLLPAVAQGAIGIECRIEDPDVYRVISPLSHSETEIRVRAERAMNQRLMGGCQVPIAGYSEIDHGVIVLRGLVGSLDGGEIIEGVISGRPEDAEELGQVLAEDLLARGAKEILAELSEE